MPRTRHFGATIPWGKWEPLATKFSSTPFLVEPPKISYAGEPKEQGKLMITYPSGNLIEMKAYRNPRVVLGSLAG